MENAKNKTIITVLGKDTVGIIAKVCTYLSEHGINVLDISQSSVPFAQCAEDLNRIGEEIGVAIKCQKEEIFEKMHRI